MFSISGKFIPHKTRMANRRRLQLPSRKPPKNARQLSGAKGRLHKKLIDRLICRRLADWTKPCCASRSRKPAETLVLEENLFFLGGQGGLITEIMDETLGSVDRKYMHDAEYHRCTRQRPWTVYIERFGKLGIDHTRFKDDSHVLLIYRSHSSIVGRRVDESSPMVDARLTDGSRVNASSRLSPFDGPMLSIPQVPQGCLSMDDLLKFDSLSFGMVHSCRDASEPDSMF